MPMIYRGENEDQNPMDVVATHQRCLVAAALRTQGPILELGVGWYSTLLLHEIARSQKRFLRTIDNNSDWFNQFKGLEGPYHQLQLTGWWGDADFKVPEHVGTPDLGFRWGLVFVDQSQPIEREYAMRRLMETSNVFVCHDTEEGFAYGYERTLKMFKYKYTDKCQTTHTTIVSNTIDVTKWGMVDLPPVEPTKEVT